MLEFANMLFEALESFLSIEFLKFPLNAKSWEHKILLYIIQKEKVNTNK